MEELENIMRKAYAEKQKKVNRIIEHLGETDYEVDGKEYHDYFRFPWYCVEDNGKLMYRLCYFIASDCEEDEYITKDDYDGYSNPYCMAWTSSWYDIVNDYYGEAMVEVGYTFEVKYDDDNDRLIVIVKDDDGNNTDVIIFWMRPEGEEEVDWFWLEDEE